MLAYASSRRLPVDKRPAPNALLAIIAAHVAALAAVMSARMDLPANLIHDPIVVDFIHEDDPPPPNEIAPRLPQQPSPSVLDQRKAIVPTPPLPTPNVDTTPMPLPDMGQIVRPIPDARPNIDPPLPFPVRVAAKFATPASEVRPPYPASKLASGEEAVLKLRLSIDERGRVIAVEPAGRADPAFLDSARRHILSHWRYKPATDGGRAVATSVVVTLRFELEA